MRIRRLLPCAAVWLFCSWLAQGAVHRIRVVERSDVLDGRSFGKAGPYERIIAKAYFQVDPKNPANRIISDIDLAPVNEEGKVEFSADLYVLKPRDTARGNGAILFEVVNRGRKLMLSQLCLAEPSSDPRTEAEFGDAFLLEQGFALVWLGWQFDVPREEGRMRIYVPVARNKDGSPITGLVRADFVPNRLEYRHSLADRSHVPYRVLDPGDPSARLTVRDRVDAPRREIPRKNWRFSEDGGAVELPSGFQPGKIYEVVYRSKDPALVGLGPAAVRDLVSFLKYNEPRRNTLLGAEFRHLDRALAFGVSQSGRFLRTFLYYGLNKDEQGKRVFDGVWAHVAGAGRGSFNHRFAQPSRDAHPHMNFFYPTDIFPFTDLTQRDPETGLEGGILARAQAGGVVPKIFYTNTSYEYWGRAGSLIHTTLDGSRDAEIPATTRIYFLTGAQHGPRNFPPSRSGTQYLSNPMDYRWAMRALLAAFDKWVKDGVAPPPSRYPRIDRGELVPLEKVRFPKIPGVRFPDRMHRAWRVDYGPEFYTEGIVSIEPPKVGKPFVTLVPQVDADGNEIAGVRLPVLQAALGTFTGWNYRAPEIGAPEELADMIGSYFPFARTEAEREKAGDPRRSVAERFADEAAYREALRDAARRLAAQGYVLERDIGRIVEAGMAQWDFVMGADAP